MDNQFIDRKMIAESQNMIPSVQVSIPVKVPNNKSHSSKRKNANVKINTTEKSIAQVSAFISDFNINVQIG